MTPKGQWEAGRVSLSRTQTFVALPPALQRIYPALVSQCIIVMLGSSVVSQVSYELTRRQPDPVADIFEL